MMNSWTQLQFSEAVEAQNSNNRNPNTDAEKDAKLT